MDNCNSNQNNSDNFLSNNQRRNPKKPVVISVFCACIGFVVGALGIFGIMKLTEKNTSECNKEECNCPKCLAYTDTSGGLEAKFLKMEANNQNIIYSPLSIEYAMSLLKAGADGNTKSEISQVLGDVLLPKYTNMPEKLSLANAVFIRDSFTNYVLDSYINTVKQDYDAEIIYDSFANTNKLSEWINDKTFGLIKKINLNLSDTTQMILANALAIQLDWQRQFSVGDTYGKDFYKADDSIITATTMSMSTKSDDIKYYVDDKLTLLSLPLESVNGTTLDFLAVMPDDNLTDYIATFKLDDILAMTEEMKPASTFRDGADIYIPKFGYEYTLDFVKDLKALGINLAFSDDADFSKMAEKPLKVSDAIHKANIDFSEKGIKAASVTVIAMAINESIEEPIEKEKIIINIDRPFLFLIRDCDNGTTWFIGAVFEPNLWEEDREEYGR